MINRAIMEVVEDLLKSKKNFFMFISLRIRWEKGTSPFPYEEKNQKLLNVK